MKKYKMIMKGKIRKLVLYGRYLYFTKVYKVNLDTSTFISFGAKLDKTNPKGIHIGKNTVITSGCIILSHDSSRKLHADTIIGDNCFIGVNSVILPGVTISNNCIIGAGSIVNKNIHPPYSVAAGNPVKIIKENKNIGKYGVINE